MFNLNELCVIAYENAAKREAKDGKVSTDTMQMLKHTATEVVEATEAYVNYSALKQLGDMKKDGEAMFEGLEEPDAAYQSFCEDREHFASELADIICCILIIAGKERIDMEYALTECMEKNYKRAIGEGDK